MSRNPNSKVNPGKGTADDATGAAEARSHATLKGVTEASATSGFTLEERAKAKSVISGSGDANVGPADHPGTP